MKVHQTINGTHNKFPTAPTLCLKLLHSAFHNYEPMPVREHYLQAK